MSGSVKPVIAASVVSILLSVSVTSAHTTADLTLQDWTLNGDNKVSKQIEGTTTIVDCNQASEVCEVSYSGTIDVNLSIEDNTLVLTPDFAMSEVSRIEPVAVESEIDSEVGSEL